MCGRKAVRKIRWKFWIVLLALLVVYGSGCGGTKHILVLPGTPVQLGEDVRARIYAGGVRSNNRVTIPEGWWCLPPDPNDFSD